jgi:hypothetical protein
MRVVSHSLLAAGVIAGSGLLTAPGAEAATGTVTVCAKSLVKKPPVWLTIGFTAGVLDGFQVEQVANNKCWSRSVPTPSDAYVEAADSPGEVRTIVLDGPSGRTVRKNTHRADFPLGAGEHVTATFYFAVK